MTFGRGKLLASVGAAAVEARQARRLQPRRTAERREIDSLRAVNAHLTRELAALREREAQALRLADRDPLTGLYNRRCMQGQLSAAIDEATAQRHNVGVLFIDLNGFKAVNDAHGHAAGDKILSIVATRLAARVRIGDVVCRYGGDEFVVVLPNVADAGALRRVAAGLRERVALPYSIDGRELPMSAAIGAALFPRDGDSAAGLLQRADQAMYADKLGAASRPAAAGAPASAPARRRSDRAGQRHGGAI